jgi:hypothetical protein
LEYETSYPPYNIEKTGDDRYAISLAVAGFSPEEMTITAEQNTLTVKGSKAVKDSEQMLYQGISARSFRRTFSLADHVQVQGGNQHAIWKYSSVVTDVTESIEGGRVKWKILRVETNKFIAATPSRRGIRPRNRPRARCVRQCVRSTRRPTRCPQVCGLSVER